MRLKPERRQCYCRSIYAIRFSRKTRRNDFVIYGQDRWAQELHAFLRACVRFFTDETVLQLLKVVIHHGEIKQFGGWQAVAFATGTLGKLGHSTSTHY